jgi:hypothetical protein
MSVDSDDQSALGHAIVGFSHAGEFPDNDVSSIQLQDEQLPVALKVLGDAKSELEVTLLMLGMKSPCSLCPRQRFERLAARVPQRSITGYKTRKVSRMT